MNFSMSALMKLGVPTALFGSLFFAQAVLAEDRTPTLQQPPQPSLNFYGLPGGIDTPSATPLPDGQIAIGVSTFAGTTRTTLTFHTQCRTRSEERPTLCIFYTV